MENQVDTEINHKESKNIVPETSRNKMSTWNIACIILFAVGVVFFIIFFDRYHHILILHYDWAIIISALVAMVIIILCFFTTRTKISAFKVLALITAVIVLAADWYIYFRYIPKYTLSYGCAIVKADPEYASATVEPQYFCPDESLSDMRTSVTYEIKDNPFYEWGYILNIIKDGKVTAWIAFDTATGKYYVFYEPKD